MSLQAHFSKRALKAPFYSFLVYWCNLHYSKYGFLFYSSRGVRRCNLEYSEEENYAQNCSFINDAGEAIVSSWI